MKIMICQFFVKNIESSAHWHLDKEEKKCLQKRKNQREISKKIKPITMKLKQRKKLFLKYLIFQKKKLCKNLLILKILVKIWQ
jgi:hypothetical protein